MSAQEEIQELQRQIENLRTRAIMEIKVKLAEARNNVVDLENRIAELSGNAPSAQTAQPRKARVRVTIKQIVEAIQGGAINYRMVADKLGCSPSIVAQKIKAEGKRAGIKCASKKANFVLSVK
jgi:hypothetical protein